MHGYIIDNLNIHFRDIFSSVFEKKSFNDVIRPPFLKNGSSYFLKFSFFYKARCISFILMYNLLGFERLKFVKIAY